MFIAHPILMHIVSYFMYNDNPRRKEILKWLKSIQAYL